MSDQAGGARDGGPARVANWRLLCAREDDSADCLLHPILLLLNSSDPASSVKYFTGYPTQNFGGRIVDNALTFGGVTTQVRARGALPRAMHAQPRAQVDGDGRTTIASARAMRLAYFLRTPQTDAEERAVDAWQRAFVDLVSSLHYPGVELHFTSATSWTLEVARNGVMLVPFMPLLFFVLVRCGGGAAAASEWRARRWPSAWPAACTATAWRASRAWAWRAS